MAAQDAIANQRPDPIEPGHVRARHLRLFRLVLPWLVVFSFVLTTTPMFFGSYRSAAFDTAPRDDYAPFLLALTGDQQDTPNRQSTLLSDAPFGYRVLSVAAALPAYYILPYYAFSNIEEPDEPYLRASAAIVFVSYVSLLSTILVIYLIARRQLGRSRIAAVVAAWLGLGLVEFMGLSGVDGVALLTVATLLYFIDRPRVFVPLVLVAALVNEKVVIIFVVLTAARFLAWLWDRRAWREFPILPQLVASLGSLAIYLVARLVVLRLPGNEGQLDPTAWPSAMLSTVRATLTLQGLAISGIALFIMAILVSIAWLMARTPATGRGPFQRSDVMVAAALVFTALAIDVQFTAGRLVLHSFPLFVPMLAVLIDVYIKSGRWSRPRYHRSP